MLKVKQAQVYLLANFNDNARRNNCGGFTYFGILLTVALMGTTLAAVGSSWSVQNRRAQENQLLYVGQTIRKAIASYYNNPSAGAHQYPRSLKDLLNDRRGGKLQRHLREIYRDPMTGQADWSLITIPDGSIIGVASRATGQPLKRNNFGAWETAFVAATCYCDWQFVYLPQLVSDSPLTG